MTWALAQSTCQNNNMELVSLSSAAKDSLITGVAANGGDKTNTLFLILMLNRFVF